MHIPTPLYIAIQIWVILMVIFKVAFIRLVIFSPALIPDKWLRELLFWLVSAQILLLL